MSGSSLSKASMSPSGPSKASATAKPALAAPAARYAAHAASEYAMAVSSRPATVIVGRAPACGQDRIMKSAPRRAAVSAEALSMQKGGTGLPPRANMGPAALSASPEEGRSAGAVRAAIRT